MKKFNFVALTLTIIGVIASIAFAQNTFRGPLTTANRVAFEAPSNLTTVAEATSFEYRLYRGGTPVTAFTNVTCVAAVAPLTGFTCEAPLSQANIDALNFVGVHQLTLSAFRADVGEGPQSGPLALTSPVGAARNLRIR